MNPNLYLRQVLKKYLVNNSIVTNLRRTLFPLVREWAGKYLVKFIPTGSIVKGTAVATGTDVDFFISLSSQTPLSLKEIYYSLCDFLTQKRLLINKQNVSVGLYLDNIKVDLVPARRQGPQGYDHSLYLNRRDTWTQTNINKHISIVRNSNRILEIRLTKIWRDLFSLDFPSFYLELAVVNSLRSNRHKNLAYNFLQVLYFLTQDFVVREFVDPANSNNVISDDLSTEARKIIASMASRSLQQSDLQYIVW
jgi:hypothetical protein